MISLKEATALSRHFVRRFSQSPAPFPGIKYMTTAFVVGSTRHTADSREQAGIQTRRAVEG